MAWNTLFLALLTAAGTTLMGTLIALYAERGNRRLGRALNVLAYEMEAGTLFTMGGIYGFSTGCVCAVLAARSHSEEIVPAVKERAEGDAIRVALDALTGFIATPARP